MWFMFISMASYHKICLSDFILRVSCEGHSDAVQAGTWYFIWMLQFICFTKTPTWRTGPTYNAKTVDRSNISMRKKNLLKSKYWNYFKEPWALFTFTGSQLWPQEGSKASVKAVFSQTLEPYSKRRSFTFLRNMSPFCLDKPAASQFKFSWKLKA